MTKGFMYLTAVIEVYGRFIVGFTLDGKDRQPLEVEDGRE